MAVLGVGVAWTSIALPPVVASHFGPGGQANGVLPRGVYALTMTGLVVGLPLVAALLPTAFGAGSLNIPHRDHWLAPARRDATLAFLRVHLARLGIGIAGLLAGVHACILIANRRQPAELDPAWLAVLLVPSAVGLAAWLGSLYRRFPRPGDADGR